MLELLWLFKDRRARFLCTFKMPVHISRHSGELDHVSTVGKDRLLSQQPFELVSDYPVTFAHGFFQLLPVEDLDVTADVTNRSGILQATRGDGHALAAYTQHIGDQFLSHN